MFWKLYGFEAEMLHYALDFLNFIKWLIIIFILKNSPLSKLINYFFHCPCIWYCTYKIILVISKTNTVFPNPV